jgi:hypothetical protein
MEEAQEVGLSLHEALKPYESVILKFEQVVLFYHPVQSAILFGLVNIVFLGFWYLGLSFYCYLFLIISLVYLWPLYGKPLLLTLATLLIPPADYEPTEEGGPRIYRLSELCAFAATLYYVFDEYRDGAIGSVLEKETFNVLLVGFILSLLFYLFLSVSDALAVFIFINVLLLVPAMIQRQLGRMTAFISAQASQIGSQWSGTWPGKFSPHGSRRASRQRSDADKPAEAQDPAPQ